jgi:outer membrane biosynthesis protein TonB
MRDMEFDLDSVEFRPKKRSAGRWLFAAALVGAAGFGAVKYQVVPMPQFAVQSLTAAAASPARAPEPVAAPARAADPPAPVVATPTPTTEPKKDTALPDEVKERLAKADKILAEKQKVKQQQLQQRQEKSAASRPRRGPSGGDKVFRKGGETGDPLNSAL